MGKSLYKTSREIVVLVGTIILIYFVLDDESARGASVLFLSGWYVYISRKYQNKYNVLSPGYIFITFNMMIVYVFLSALITEKQINELNASGLYGWWTNDYYWLYFYCVIILFCGITMYLAFVQPKKHNLNISEIKNIDIKDAMWGIIVLLVIYFISGLKNDYIYPIVVLSIIQCMLFKRYIYILLLSVVLLIDGGNLVMTRYNLIQVIMPLIFVFTYKYSELNLNRMNRYIFLLILIFVVGMYGTVSEIIKLNKLGADYSIVAILGSFDQTFDFFARQFYRVFGIWIKLGGYIIYHVDKNGFFYGLSFIKGMADFFNVEYISIPELSAVYDNATYAQVGALAEGYANFGIAGATLYMMVIFLFMEKMMQNFIIKQSLNNLLCVTVPFTKILIDGGSLYSAIFLWLCCKVLFVGENIKNYISCRKNNEVN